MTEWVRAYTKKYQEVGLLYDHDIGNKQRLLRIRLTNSPLPETPVTPSYQARFIVNNVRAIAARPQKLNPRRYTLCYRNEDFTQTTRTVYEPYTPNNSEHGKIYSELVNGDLNFDTISYNGEAYISGYEALFNE